MHSGFIHSSGWAKHRTFGLKQEWLSTYLQHPDNWEDLGFLGARQVDSLRTWLRTTGLVNRASEETSLAEMFRASGTPSLQAWEYLWINTTFNFATAAWYVGELQPENWTTTELRRLLSQSAPTLAPRTVSSGIFELVGLLEHTPVGSGLGQGKVDSSCRPRRVGREGFADPSLEAIAYALRLLFDRLRTNVLNLNQALLWPWAIFGCDKGNLLRKLVAYASQEFEIGDNTIRLLDTL